MERQKELRLKTFQELMTEIGHELQPRDVERFKDLFKDRLPPSVLDDIDSHGSNSGLELLKKLQKEGCLTEDNFKILKELFPVNERHDLLEKLFEFEIEKSITSCQKSKSPEISRQISSDLGIEMVFERKKEMKLLRDDAKRALTIQRESVEELSQQDDAGRGQLATVAKTLHSIGDEIADYECDSFASPSIFQVAKSYVSDLWRNIPEGISDRDLPSLPDKDSGQEGTLSRLAFKQNLHLLFGTALELQNVRIAVEGGFHKIPSLGILLQIQPHTVICPTDIICARFSGDSHYPPTDENETLVSCCVRICTPLLLKKPLNVVIEHSGPSKKEGYETIVKARDPRKKYEWKQIKEIKEDSPFAREHFQSSYIEVEISEWSDLVVVTRLIRDAFEVTDKGCVVRSSVSEDVTVDFPAGAVNRTHNGSMKLLLMPDHIDILDGIAAYPSSMLLIDGFEGVSFKVPVKIRLPHPYPAGYPSGNVRLLTMDAPHEWKDITDQVHCVESESSIELQVSHFSALWVWIYDVPSTVASSLSQYLFKPPQEVYFAVFKEKEVYSNATLTMTLVCVPNKEQFERTDAMERRGYKPLASTTGDKKMRPDDKAYAKVEGCYKKKIKEDIFLRFIQNDICRKELPLVRKSNEKGKSVSSCKELIISLLEKKDGDSKDILCKFCIDEAKIATNLFEKERFPELQDVKTVGLEIPPSGLSGVCSSETENHPITRTSLAEDPSCQELVEYMAGLDLQSIDAVTAAAQVSEKLQLDKYSMKDPPQDVVKKCKYLCALIKEKGRTDIVEEIRKELPSGITGPLTNENVLVEGMIGKLEDLTRALCGSDKWKEMAEHLGIRGRHFEFYGRKENPAKSILEDVCLKRKLTVGDLYDVLCKIDANALADEFL